MPTTSVLIIEKEEPQVRLLAWGLRQEGYTVYTAQGADGAVSEAGIAPDIIVFNTGMPRASKRLWVNTLRHLVDGVRIVDLSPEPTSVEETGADACLTEPYRIDTLIEIIRTLRPDARNDSPAQQ